jgi:hypothetical protein
MLDDLRAFDGRLTSAAEASNVPGGARLSATTALGGLLSLTILAAAQPAQAQAAPAGCVTVSAGQVTCSGNFGQYAPTFTTPTTVTVDNTGVANRGVVISGDVSNALINNGNVSSDFFNALDIHPFDNVSTSSITNNGTASTTGTSANNYGNYGIAAYSGTGTTVNNTGTVYTTGGRGIGIYAESKGGAGTTVTISGTVHTTGGATTSGSYNYGYYTRGSQGVVATSVAGPVTVTVAKVNDGDAASIQTEGDDATGIYARTYGANGAITITSNDLSTLGTNANGIDAVSATGPVTITNNGTLSATGAGSEGIRAVGQGPVSVTNAANASITSAGTGIFVSSTSDAGTANNDGAIYTTADNAPGISVSGTTATVTGTGSVTTYGNFSDGVDATASGAVSVTQGNVTTYGSSSRGIVASSTGAGDVTVNVGNRHQHGCRVHRRLLCDWYPRECLCRQRDHQRHERLDDG